jgi:5,10-methenyltetrahydrofolate synthetase
MKDWAEISAWRGQQRRQLIEQRQQLAEATRRELDATIDALIEQAFVLPRDKVVAFCWPYKGEVDVRFAVRSFRARGASAALPAVTARNQPLQFHQWWPGVAMSPGALGIPVPQHTQAVTPDMAIVPVVGFDPRGYRLGYGGGYFDRTLAALPRKPITVGVGLEAARLATIYPQAHDIPMDFIVTEAGIQAVSDGRLELVDPAAAADAVKRLAAERGLW